MATGVDAKLLKSTKFPPEFSQKVDMQKVNLQVMKKWIASKISDILGSEDDVVIELCFNLIEGSRFVSNADIYVSYQLYLDNAHADELQPDIKSLQIQLTGFLDKDTAPFCKELWKLCLSAQTSPQGVPKELLEAKKLELIQEKIEADRAADEARRRREDAERREQEISRMRDRDRGRGRGDTWRGRRGDRDYDQRGRYGGRFGENRSRSPALRYRDQRESGSFRGSQRDSYVPRDRRGTGRDTGRRRAPTRSPSIGSASSRPTSRSRSAERERDSSRGSASLSPQRRRRGRSSSSGRHSRNRPRSPRRGEGGQSNFRRKRSPSSSRSTPPPSPDRRPAPKRRRYSSSRSRSPKRDRRSRSRSSSSGSSRSSRSRSRNSGRSLYHGRAQARGQSSRTSPRRHRGSSASLLQEDDGRSTKSEQGEKAQETGRSRQRDSSPRAERRNVSPASSIAGDGSK